MGFLKSLADPLARLERSRRRALLDPALPGDLREFYAVPLPEGTLSLYDTGILSIDFETTGLDFTHDCILSMGGVGVTRDGVELTTAFHEFLKVPPEAIRRDTAIINFITPEQVTTGDDARTASVKLLRRVGGRPVLCHCAAVETGFLRASLGIPPNLPLPFLTIDSMMIERTLHRETGRPGEYSLSEIRRRRGLPPYEAHNAAADAIATAELLLVQLKEIFGESRPTLRETFRRSR